MGKNRLKISLTFFQSMDKLVRLFLLLVVFLKKINFDALWCHDGNLCGVSSKWTETQPWSECQQTMIAFAAVFCHKIVHSINRPQHDKTGEFLWWTFWFGWFLPNSIWPCTVFNLEQAFCNVLKFIFRDRQFDHFFVWLLFFKYAHHECLSRHHHCTTNSKHKALQNDDSTQPASKSVLLL